MASKEPSASKRNKRAMRTMGVADAAAVLLELKESSSLTEVSQRLLPLKESFKSPSFAPRILKLLSKAKRSTTALHVLRFLQEQELVVDAFHYSAVMSALASDVTKWTVVINLLEEMVQASIQQDSVILNCAINACGKSDRWETSLLLWKESLVDRETHTANAVIAALARAGEWTRALEFLGNLPGVVPDVITFSSAMAACEKGSAWRHAMDLLESMHSAALQPDRFSYSSVIASCATAERWELACHFFDTMKAGAVLADVVSFGSLIKALDSGEKWQSAVSILDTIREESCAVSQVACNSAINACSSASQWQLAITLLDSMPDLCVVSRDIISYTTAINACARASRWQNGLSLFQKLLESPIKPNLICFNSALSACQRSSKWQLTLSLLGVMTRKRFEPDEVSLTTALSSCESGGWQLCLQLLSNLQGEHVVVTPIMFGVLMSACENDCAWVAALATLRSIQAHRLIPDALHTGSAANALRKSKEGKSGEASALHLLLYMKEIWSKALASGDSRKLRAAFVEWQASSNCGAVVRIGDGAVACLKPAGIATERFVEELNEAVFPRVAEAFSIVSRLDHPTSGILMLALGNSGTPEANWLQVQFASRLVDKKYICLCEGPTLGCVGSTGSVSASLLTDEIQGRSAVSSEPGSREALTHYRVIARYSSPWRPNSTSELMLLSVKPVTGRTHQIRVHMAHLGRPLVGDLTYGPREESILECQRLFLHCRRVRLRDFSNCLFTAVASLPAELRSVLDQLRKSQKLGWVAWLWIVP